MRKITDNQLRFGEVDISQIKLNEKSRDDIPKLLRGLQYIYCTPELRKEVFKILEKMMPENKSWENGRPGMDLWKILVMGTVRLNCNWDYDRLTEMANNHRTLREMLGHGEIDENYEYKRQTLKDNISLLTEEILDEINQAVVKAGQKLVLKKKRKKPNYMENVIRL